MNESDPSAEKKSAVESWVIVALIFGAIGMLIIGVGGLGVYRPFGIERLGLVACGLAVLCVGGIIAVVVRGNR